MNSWSASKRVLVVPRAIAVPRYMPLPTVEAVVIVELALVAIGDLVASTNSIALCRAFHGGAAGVQPSEVRVRRDDGRNE
ncbi:hypothetical protein ON010_g17523 [Phytophthora cinnamomi]|nr:hypothetical protein ON010_g17523 [Phytophthora cinnamomi]